jgi:hypothetical protein
MHLDFSQGFFEAIASKKLRSPEDIELAIELIMNDVA